MTAKYVFIVEKDKCVIGQHRPGHKNYYEKIAEVADKFLAATIVWNLNKEHDEKMAERRAAGIIEE